MNRPLTKGRRQRAMALIDCMVYIALSMLLLGLGLVAFYRCADNTKALRRNADDITRALHIGELWRMDVRNATATVQWNAPAGTLRIPQQQGEVQYRFADGQVWRKAAPTADWTPVLIRVARSEMLADSRGQIPAWRWELELQRSSKAARIRPLFTFAAVPQSTVQP